jgi:electron transfer flavoprotein beta subunit
MAAKKKPLEVRTLEDLGLDPADLAEGGRVVWESLELPPPRQAGRILQGEADATVAELVRLLREEARVV